MAESKTHRKQVQAALGDEYLQTALKRAVDTYVKAREIAMAEFDFAASQEDVRALKERSIADLDNLLARFKQEAEDVGVVVHDARDGIEAAAIIRKLADERGVKLIVKSKSLLTDELALNPRLEKAGFEVVETDLGEWIIQLAGEKPSHFTQPAVHKTREQIAKLFSKVTGEDLDADVQKLVEVARRELRRAFIDADMGISGANIAIAETGGIVLVSNEGNARLVTSLPPIHVAVVGIEKLVETMDDALAILKVLSKSGTGQKQTSYVSFITGPSRTTDIEKTLALGVHGPKEMHVILVDGGRRNMLTDDTCREALYCIKCGACLNMCPVYRSVGGHAYGNAYMGGIGSVLTAFHRNLDATEDTLGLCAGCGYCASVCPSKIDTPGMTLELKQRLAAKNGIPFLGRMMLGFLKDPARFQKLIRTARAFQGPMLDSDGAVKSFPLSLLTGTGRKMPGLASSFLRDTLPEESASAGNTTVSLFAGCMIDFLYPEIGEAMWKVMTRGGMRALFPKSQSCCGAPALYAGDRDTARSLAIDNILAMEVGSPDYVVTGCPTCAVMLKEHFPALLAGTQWEDRAARLAKRVMDFSQFACDVLDINPANRMEGLVTYHDPCHQVRGLETSDRARELIRRTGLELVEMTEPDQCCGFAGSYSVKQAGISSAILDRKIAHIEATGAPMLVTDCPGCIMQIRGGLMERGSAVRVCHTAELMEI